MFWEDQVQPQVQDWLLHSPDPGVRYLTRRDLLDSPPEDRELQADQLEAHRQGAIAAILAKMQPEGFWEQPGPGYLPKYRSTVWSLIMLAQLGALAKLDERIACACAYFLDHALAPGGQLSASGAPSGTADCLQGNMCWALLELGYDDPRLEPAFEWMARTVTGEGLAPASDRRAERRYYAGKCGPDFACGSNNKLPCAWGGVKVMLAFGRLPDSQHTPLFQRAVDAGVKFLFSTDPAKADYPSGFSEKPSGNWWKFGFPVFYVTDLLQIVEALVRLGYQDDPRLEIALGVIHDKQDASGRWALDYDYSGKTWVAFGEKKQPNAWVTLRALRVLKAAA